MIIADRRVRYAFLSILSNTLLIIFKAVAGLLSGSVSIISEVIHSGMDLVASLVAFFSVRHSARPADEEHPFGHGKIENFSGIVEGVLIFVAAIMIIYEAVRKLVTPEPVTQVTVAIAVMFISALINLFVSKSLFKVAKQEDSMALEADALHLKTDVYTSAGVGLGILLIKLTNLHILDPLVAIAVALLIVKEAWELTSNAFNHLLDARLPEADEAQIRQLIESFSHEFRDYHKLKTRKSGKMKHIDFHLTLDPNLTVLETHDLVGRIKRAMSEKIKNTRVNIHIDPYSERTDTSVTPNHRTKTTDQSSHPKPPHKDN